MTQAQIAYNHDIDIMVKTLHSHPLTIPDVSNHSVRAKESCCFGNQDSTLAHHIELDEHQNFENHIDILASYLFSKIEHENEFDPEAQLDNSISLPDSIVTPVSSPGCNFFPESILDTVLVHYEIESPIFYDHHIEFHTVKSLIDKLASFHFYEVELR